MTYPRYITPRIRAALKDTPVVFINGPRQSGKSTLVHDLLKLHERVYVTLDDISQLEFAAEEPMSFLEAHREMTIDEIQRLPGLFLTLKLLVDKARRPGRFLLTGSADVLLIPKIADSLAGRMEILTLYPLSRAEITGDTGDLIQELFAQKPLFNPKIQCDLPETLALGGFPEVQERKDPSRRAAWFDAYITTLLGRDVRELANIEGISKLPNLLKLIASRTSNILNLQELSRTSGLSASTLKRYCQLLQALFLIDWLPAWSCHRGKRLVKSPKVFVSDSGLLCHLLGLDPKGLRTHSLWGSALETFIVGEIKKRLSWSSIRAELFHYRTAGGDEVDLVLESPDGRVVGIEIKGAAQIKHNMFKGLRHLAKAASENFVRGIVFYTGDEVIHFGDQFVALPINLII